MQDSVTNPIKPLAKTDAALPDETQKLIYALERHLVKLEMQYTELLAANAQIETLANKNEELRRIIAEKDKFFSIIAHDLRSPFNGFLGLTELMAEKIAEMTLDEIKNIAGMMKNSATNLNHLLGNLLEWSRMQRGLVSFNPMSYNLRKIMDESLVIVLEAAKAKNIRIDSEIPEDLRIFGDKNMLQSIIRNLVSNAVKFTPRGGRITLYASANSKSEVEFSIKDTGIGMNKTIIGNLFRLDVQTGRKGTDGELTTGLGLMICKDFIEKHNGKLWVESEVGEGSNFHFVLPMH